jgi:hypothetical protein
MLTTRLVRSGLPPKAPAAIRWPSIITTTIIITIAAQSLSGATIITTITTIGAIIITIIITVSSWRFRAATRKGSALKIGPSES